MVHVTVKATSMTTVGGVVIVRAVVDVAEKINATRRRLCQIQRKKTRKEGKGHTGVREGEFEGQSETACRRRCEWNLKGIPFPQRCA
jgi:hypothetical protein